MQKINSNQQKQIMGGAALGVILGVIGVIGVIADVVINIVNNAQNTKYNAIQAPKQPDPLTFNYYSKTKNSIYVY